MAARGPRSSFFFLLDFFFFKFFFRKWRGEHKTRRQHGGGPSSGDGSSSRRQPPPPPDFLFLFFFFLGGGLVWNEYTAQCPSPLGGGDIREHETPDLSHRGACPVGVRTPRFASLAARPQFQSGSHGQWHAQSPPLFIAVLIPRCIFQTKTNVKRL